MPKKIYIHCDGGFGNRFNSLTVGLMIAEKGGFDPVVLWPSTNLSLIHISEPTRPY